MNKIFLLTVSFFAFTVTFSAGDDEVIKVMSYNIRVAFDEGENSWDNRKDIVASLIKNYDPDIIGLQEVLKTQLDDLLERLPEYSWVGVGRDDGKTSGEFSAIFFKSERFEIVEDSTIWLSDTPEIPSIGWDAAYKRIITWAKIKDKLSGKTFYHFNTHLDHKGEIARLEGANLLNDKVAEIAVKDPAIVTGDLNFTPDDKAYQLLVGGRRDYLFDAQKMAEENISGDNTTFNGFEENFEKGRKLDYIFIKNDVVVKSHRIIPDKIYGRYPSDHMPVLAEVKIK